jgi:uncharacterized protein YggE
VRGTATLEKPADQLELVFAVVTQEPTAAGSASRNAELMSQVQKMLRKAGVAADELATLDFRLDPVYSQRPRDADPEWQPTVQSYRVSNRVRVRSQALARAGELIDVATQAGANSVDAIQFGLADPRKHRDAAIRAATANALADARSLADAASLELVRILEIALEPEHAIRLPHEGRAALAMAESTPITPGAVEIRSEVSVLYEIAPRR